MLVLTYAMFGVLRSRIIQCGSVACKVFLHSKLKVDRIVMSWLIAIDYILDDFGEWLLFYNHGLWSSTVGPKWG